MKVLSVLNESGEKCQVTADMLLMQIDSFNNANQT